MVYAGHCSQQDSASACCSLRVHRFSFPQHNTKTNKRAIQTHLLKYAWAVCCRHQVTQLESWQVRGHWVTETWQESKQLGLLQLYFALHVGLSLSFFCCLTHCYDLQKVRKLVASALVSTAPLKVAMFQAHPIGLKLACCITVSLAKRKGQHHPA